MLLPQVLGNVVNRNVFRTMLNIYEAFLRKQLTILAKKLRHI